MTRITGLATGLDVDSIVKETMQAERTKIDAVEQEKKLVQIQQDIYREVIKECRDFYDKYFNMTKADSVLLQKNWAGVSFESSNSSVVTATASGGAEVDNYSVQVLQLASPAKATITDKDLESMDGIVVTIKDKDNKDVEITIDLSSGKTNTDKVSIINNKLKEHGITAKYSSFSGGISLISNKDGKEQKFTAECVKFKKDADGKVQVDSDGKYNIESKGDKKEAIGTDCIAKLTNGLGESYNYLGNSNTLSLDSVTFKFTDVNAKGTPKYDKDGNIEEINDLIELSSAKITGKTDAVGIKDKLVNFVEDYNKIMTKLNTLINEKRDKDYMPLTDDQKKEMTDKQIELWEAKVKEGQLSRDSDLTRIRNAMKSAMSSVSSSGLSLEKIGITPSKDYSGNKNGTYTVDENKLLSALEKNTSEVMELFVNKSENNNGILNQLKNTLDKETQNTTSSLLKKAGMEGSATASNNTLSKKIATYETKIVRLEKLFSKKQQNLYSKYASLETLMNNLNSQMNYLSSMFSS
mgnify:FL=1